MSYQNFGDIAVRLCLVFEECEREALSWIVRLIGDGEF